MRKVRYLLFALLLVAGFASQAAAQTPQPTTHYVQLTWVCSTASSVIEQRVMRASIACPATGIPAGLTKIGTITDNVTKTFDDKTALAGQPYCYTVRAFNGFEESADSNTTQAVIPFPPSAPTNAASSVQK